MMTTGGVWVIDDEYSGTLRSNIPLAEDVIDDINNGQYWG